MRNGPNGPSVERARREAMSVAAALSLPVVFVLVVTVVTLGWLLELVAATETRRG